MAGSRTRPWWSAAVAAGLCGVLVAGCGGDDEAQAPTAEPSSQVSRTAPEPGTTDDAATPSGSPTSASTPVVADESAQDFAARAFGVADAAAQARSCPGTEQFYRDFLLPELAAALAESPGACDAATGDGRFRYRVRGLSAFDPENFYTDPIPEQALAPLDDAERVSRVDLAGTTKRDFAHYWLVVSEDDRFYLFHPVLFQIATCFDERFRTLPGAPAWCTAG